MFQPEFIQAHNDSVDSFRAVWAVAKFLRNQVPGYADYLLSDKDDRCSIHIPVFEEFTGAGCGDVAIGAHPSIASLYDKSAITFCHAEPGARVIDLEFARKVAALDQEFVDVAIKRTSKFIKRYQSGAYVDWKRYGRGYCYLQLLHPNIRHRVARILGPFPLVLDVFRFVLVAGNWGDQGFFFERISGNCLHVVTRNWSPGTSMRHVLTQIVGYDSDQRIGGQYASTVSRFAIGFSDLYGQVGYTQLAPDVDSINKFVSLVPVSRAKAMLAWMADHGIAQSEDVLACLLIATSGLAALNVDGMGELKAKVRMWQVIGDLVCKQFVAMHVLALGDSVEEYSRLVGKDFQSNKRMASVIISSDLFPVCSAEGLSLESKAWADILEGVVGVITLMQPASVLKGILEHFHLIPIGLGDVVYDLIPKSVPTLLQLNSAQWRRAAESFVRSKI